VTKQDVVIVESGGANIASLKFALQRLGLTATVSADAARITAATHIILPGVGAAAEGMQRLRERRLDAIIPRLTQPVLGICLGMQLLMDSSEEGATTCLGIIPGRALRFVDSPVQPVPHMGWNTLEIPREVPLLDGIGGQDYAYFVHSFAVPVGNKTIACAQYIGTFSAAVQSHNFYGTQFHPERSAGVGARILRNFVSLPVSPCA